MRYLIVLVLLLGLTVGACESDQTGGESLDENVVVIQVINSATPQDK